MPPDAASGAPPLCEHVLAVEEALLAAGWQPVYRGQPWTSHCRQWVYFDGVLDLASLRRRLQLAACVVDHVHRGTHDGAEAGLVCSACHDAVMGLHPDLAAGKPVFA